ncbi:MAG: fumarylacetoacetate hydrolase family protein [Oscillospiraceae bacterium]|nr:fumarylacetoacetate hydrolase family protein [Oscillospiraceae bacterium]
MKLCAFFNDNAACVGVKTKHGIINITALGFPSCMNEIISGGDDMLRRIESTILDSTLSKQSEDNLVFLPVTEPKKIICKGLNYKSHAEETGQSAPDDPVFFCKFGDSLSAHKQPVTLPPWLDAFDYEAELVIVIGKPAYNVTPKEAYAHIFGYTCGNDLSARKAQALSSQWLCGKALPGFAPVGPYVVTSDSFNPDNPTKIHCKLNGMAVQSGNTSDMIFSCAQIVSAASKYFPLSSGDLIFTGTPPGVIVGKKREDRVWLSPGDVVDVIIDEIGTLTTPLI